jgi:hypothetical protein
LQRQCYFRIYFQTEGTVSVSSDVEFSRTISESSSRLLRKNHFWQWHLLRLSQSCWYCLRSTLKLYFSSFVIVSSCLGLCGDGGHCNRKSNIQSNREQSAGGGNPSLVCCWASISTVNFWHKVLQMSIINLLITINNLIIICNNINDSF